jgi:tripartite-type tricarboxylate transporter receptor subunit TctC
MKPMLNQPKSPIRRFSLLVMAATATCGLLGANNAVASGYPERPITLVVSYAPGGGVDTVARLLGRELSAILKQTVVIENRPGAAGTIGASYVARANPDGYTLLVGDVALVTAPHLMKKVGYNLEKDFAPISALSYAPLVLTVPQGSSINSLPQLTALAKKSSSGLTFSSAGNGSTPHLSGELLKVKTHTNLIHVPYKGSGPAMTDLIGGRLDFAFSTIAAARSFITQGKLNVLATTGTERPAEFANVPTVAESVPGFKVIFWTGLLAPTKTPPEILGKLNDAVRQALASEKIVEALKSSGESPSYLPLKQAKTFFTEEYQRWGGIIADAKISLD